MTNIKPEEINILLLATFRLKLDIIGITCSFTLKYTTIKV